MNEKNRPNKANEKVSLEPAPEATVDANDAMMIASQRLSQVRYVFIVQIEDGIPTAHSRAALEYSDAVLMGWPDHNGATKFATPQPFQLEVVESNMNSVERHLRDFRDAEVASDTDQMADQLIAITGHVARVRKVYQPDFELPTFAEINRVIKEEWNEDMSKIGAVTSRSSEQLREDIKKKQAEEKAQDNN